MKRGEMLIPTDVVIDDPSPNKRVVISYDGPKTIAVVNVDNVIGIGTARCNPIDHYNRELGKQIAIARAITHIAQRYEQHWVGLARTKEQVREQRAQKRKRVEG